MTQNGDLTEEEATAALQELQTCIIRLIDLRQQLINSEMSSEDGLLLAKDILRHNDLLIQKARKSIASLLEAFNELQAADSLRLSAIEEKTKKGKPLGVKGGTPIFLNGKDEIHVGGDSDTAFLKRMRERKEFFANYFKADKAWKVKLEKCRANEAKLFKENPPKKEETGCTKQQQRWGEAHRKKLYQKEV